MHDSSNFRHRRAQPCDPNLLPNGTYCVPSTPMTIEGSRIPV
jgi:hypothetical protein